MSGPTIDGFTQGESDGLQAAGGGLAPSATREDDALIARAWQQGQLSWLLRDYQLRLYETFWDLIERLRVAGINGAKEGDLRLGSIMGCRKIGKSHVEMLIAREFGQRYAKSRMIISCPTAKEARSVFVPALAMVEETCPPGLRLIKRGIDGIYYFQNNAMLLLEGLNSQPDNARGPWHDLAFIDEAAYVRRLSYVIESILTPMSVHTRGPTILASTRNPNPASEYNAYHAKCVALGQGVVIDVYSAGFSEAQIASEKAAVLPITWRIEYECADERDATMTVIPEWIKDTRTACIGDAAAAIDYHRITAADWGTVDNAPLIHGFVEPPGVTHPRGRLVITAETIYHGAEVTPRNVADAFRRMEKMPDGGAPPYISRVGDHNNEMLNAITFDHNLPIQKVIKPTLEYAVSQLRLAIWQRRMLISPACVHLIACLDSGAWTEVAVAGGQGDRKRILARTELQAPDGKPMRHFDALMALVYAWIAAEPRLNAIAAHSPVASLQIPLDDIAPHAEIWQNNKVSIGYGLPAPTSVARGGPPAWLRKNRK